MTVEELIETLSDMPQTALVIVDTDTGEVTPSNITYEKSCVIITAEAAPMHRGYSEPSR